MIVDGSGCRWRVPDIRGSALDGVEVEIRSIDLDDAALNAPEDLSAAERARSARLTSPLLARRFVAARVALRRLLALRLGERTPRDVIIDESAIDGKPRLTQGSQRPDLHFNIARSGPAGLIAIASAEVGVDLELPHALFGDPGFQRRFLSAAEMRAISALAPDAQARDGGRRWVRKEAILKAVGLGLSHSPTLLELEASLLDRGSAMLNGPDRRPRHVRWQDLALADGTVFAAVACSQPAD